MPVATEFINVVIPIANIDRIYPGGWATFQRDSRDLYGKVYWDDGVLFRTGAMSGNDASDIVRHWEMRGLVGIAERDGRQSWTDLCVDAGYAGGRGACDWIVSGRDWLAMRGTEDGAVAGRDAGYKTRTRLMRQHGAMALGAIIGDIAGSVFEHRPAASTDFKLFTVYSQLTDDSILTLATIDALLGDGNFGKAYRSWGIRYPRAGYGGRFRQWLARHDDGPYQSFGNGSAMRVSPVAWVARDEAELLDLARQTSAPTHDHPRGIIGAQATALAIWMARHGATPSDIRERVTALSGYDLARTTDAIRPAYTFDVTCDGSVPEAIICALESRSFEEALRLAISLGGDADTQAAIAGSIAEALHADVPDECIWEVDARLDPRQSATVKWWGRRPISA